MKNTIILLLTVLLTLFVLVLIWPALYGSSDGYQQKPVNIPAPPVAEPAPEADEPAEAAVAPEAVEPEPVAEPDPAPAPTESEPAAEAAVAPEAVEPEPVAEPDPAPAPTESEPTAEAAVAPEAVEPEPTPDSAPAPTESEPTAEPAPSTEAEATPAATVDVQIHEVKAQVTAFSPLVVFINPGDQVSWTNMNGHDSQSLEGMIPEGAEAWHSSMGDNYSHTFTVEGVYFYKCTPHWGAGMGGVIVVGKPDLDAIKAIEAKGATKRLVKKAIKAIEAHSF